MSTKQLTLWTSPIPSPNPEWIRDESPPVFWIEEVRILRSLCLDEGKRIRLKLLYRRELRGSAMTLVRSIAFDIASILASIDGTARHPRFLVHDGPRDSDLTAQLYQRIFMLARAMEGERGNGHEPPFQYIITTTEPPPHDMQRKEWLLDPVLDATDPSKRLLGVDL